MPGKTSHGTAMKPETPAHRYLREAAECELNAEKATNTADRLAWGRLAEDWTKLALAAGELGAGSGQDQTSVGTEWLKMWLAGQPFEVVTVTLRDRNKSG